MDIHVQHSRNMPEHRHQQQLFGCGQEPKSGTGSGSGSAAWTTMTRSKALKSLALLEAQVAVKFDNEGLVLKALEAYGKAVTLLEMVMKSTTSPEEYDRLLAIYDSYKYRIQSLNLESLPPNPSTPALSTTSIITSTSTASTTPTTTTVTTVGLCSLHDEPPLLPQGVYYQGQGDGLNMHSSSVSSPSRAGYALTPYATTDIPKPNNAATKSINTTNTTSTITATATGIKSTTLAAAAAAIATITASMPTTKTVNTTTTPAIVSVEESLLKQIKKQPPAPAPVPVPVPTRSQPSTSSSGISTPTLTTTTTSATASSSQQQLSSFSNPSPIQLLAPPSQEYRLRRARAGSLTTTTIRPASPIIPIGLLSPTSPTSPTSSTMSGQSPLRRQVRLHAKPIIGGPTTTTNNRTITGNLVSADEHLQLKPQQLPGGGGGSTAATSNNTRITGNLISAAEQLQLQAQQRLQKKPLLSPPHSPHPVSSITAPTTAEAATIDSLALSAPLPQILRPASPSTVTKEGTPIVVESAPLPSLSSFAAMVPLNKTRPPTPDLAANKVFLTSLPNSILATPTPPPLKSPTSPSSPSPLSMSFTSASFPTSSSPPSSPLHRTLLQARRQQQQLKKQQKLMIQAGAPLHYPLRQQSIPPPKISALLSPESSPEPNNNESTTKPTDLPQHHSPREETDRNEIDEWLPKFLTKGFDLSESWLGVHELSAGPLPRQGSSTKGPLENYSSQNAGPIQPRALFSTATTSDEERKKQEPSTIAAKEKKPLPGNKKAVDGKSLYHSHRRSLSQSSLPLQPLAQQHQHQQQQQLLSPPPLLQPNRHNQGRTSEQPSRLTLYSRTLGSLSMTSLHLFDNEPLTAAEFLSSSPIRTHFHTRYQKNSDQNKDRPASPQHQHSQHLEKHQRQRLHQRKQPQGQPWVLVPRAQQSTTMLRSQGSFSQLSNTSAELRSPTTTSTTFVSGSSLLDFVSSDDPLGGLSIPRGLPPQIPPQPTDPFLRCFWMMRQLELTMTTGGFLTRKVHVPRQVWYQRATMVRLPAADAKVSACHTITLMLEQMVAQSKRDMLNLMIGPPTPASSASSFGPLGSVPKSGSSSRSGSRSGLSSSSSSLILPYSLSSPVTPSQASFQSISTASTTATSVSVATAALVSQTPTLTHPPTPTTPSQPAFFTSSTSTSTAPANHINSANRNSGDKGSGITVLPSYNAIDIEQDRILLTKELEALESTTLHIWSKLSKKLSFVHRPGKYFGPHAVNSGAMGTNATAAARQHQYQAQDLVSSQEHEYQDDTGKDKDKEDHASTNAVGAGNDLKSQWKHFSKSVQKSMANDKVDDTTTYTDSVLRLFQSATILETMYRHYTALSATSSGPAYFASSLQTYYAQIISRLRRIGEFFSLVICAFVVRDLGEFIVKYNKRIGAWIVE